MDKDSCWRWESLIHIRKNSSDAGDNKCQEKKQDQRHIFHAYHDCLAPGGRMAAIAAAGVKFRSDYQELRDLIDQRGQMWDLEPGTFEETSVSSVLIYLRKPGTIIEPPRATASDGTNYEQGRLL